MPRKALSGWSKKPPTKEGWYWYREPTAEARALQVQDTWKTGHLSAWDWNSKGGWQLCPIANYAGEWYGPITAPP
jgi:hypothetical protein